MKANSALFATIGTLGLSATAMAFPTASGPAGTIVGGAGTWPAGGAPTALPANPATNISAAAVPDAVGSVKSITITGLTHSWIGDVQIVLVAPGGAMHNIAVRPGLFNPSVFGNDGNYAGGTYTFVQNPTGGLNLPTTSTPSVNPAAGTYNQTFAGSPAAGATWPSGALGIANTPMNSISGTAGAWSLRFLDWDAADSGTFSGWSMEYNLVPTPGALALLGFAGLVGRGRRRRA